MHITDLGTPLVNGVYPKGFNVVHTDGWQPGIEGILKRGTVITVGPSAQRFVLSADVDSDFSGGAVIEFEPPSVEFIADNSPISLCNMEVNRYDDAKFPGDSIRVSIREETHGDLVEIAISGADQESVYLTKEDAVLFAVSILEIIAEALSD